MSSSSSASPPHTQAGSCWSDLPELLLLYIVLRLPYLSDILCFSSVCRSWRLFVRSSAAVRRHLQSSPRPPLLLLPTRRSFPPAQGPPYSFLSLERGPLVALKPLLNPDYRGTRTIGLGCSQGYLILHQILGEFPAEGGEDDVIHRRLVISDPFTGREILPPPPPPDDYPSVYTAAAISAPPDHSDSLLILLTLTSVVYCRLGLGGKDGSEHCSDYTVVHPLDLNLKHNPFFVASILPLKNHRTVYAINYLTNMLMELSVSESNHGAARRELRVKIHKLEGVPWVDYCRGGYYCCVDDWHFGSQLSELDGELLVVLFLQNEGRSRGQLTWIQIHKMDFQEMRWKKAEYVLDDCALFMDTGCGRCAMFVPKPEQWGGRRSRVYLADWERSTWREFECRDGMLVPDYPSPPFVLPKQPLPRWPAPLWVYPSFLF